MVNVNPDALYWQSRYTAGHGSGAGSVGVPVQRKVDWLSALPGISSITEVGCGDFNFGAHLTERLPGAAYIGMDIAPRIVERNQIRYGNDRRRFLHWQGYIPPADLLLCVDVLFHISDPEIAQDLLSKLNNVWTKYLALSAYEYDGLDRGHVHIRKFDPSFFGTPILREVIEDDGSLFFYIFKRT
jgi:hypothetical protein